MDRDPLQLTTPHVPSAEPEATGAFSTADAPVEREAANDLPNIPGYQIEAEIARGGMGVVYRARDLQLNRLAAIKMILGHAHSSESARVRFRIEAEAAASLEHPHVVRVFEFREHGGDTFLVMEHLAGGTLEKRFAQGRMEASAAAELIGKIARGVAAAHELNIVHRDLKPGNILFDAAGEPKVTDFGLAKGPAAADLTASQAVIGTPAYMAPEQAAGRTKHLGPPADVWAIGVMLYEAVAGRRPFQAYSTAEVLVQVQTAEPPALREVPRDYRTIVERCLAKEPERRYASARELAAELDRFARGEPIHARPVGRLERTLMWARRKPTLATVYALAILAALLGGAGAFAGWSWSRAEAAREQLAGEQSRTEAARQDAVSARDQTANALRETEEARSALQRTNAELDLVNYLSTVDLAYRTSAGGTQPLETRALLNDCNPKLRNWEWHYLDRLAHPELFLLHPDLPEIERKQFYFLDAKFSPDGTRLYAVGGDPVLRAWDARTGKPLASQKSPSIFLRDVQFSRDGSKLLTCGSGGVHIWTAEPLRVERTIPVPPTDEAKAWFTPDSKSVVVAPLKSTRVNVVDIGTGNAAKSYDIPPGEQVWGAGFPDGKLRLVTMDRRNPNDIRPSVIRIRDVERGAEPIVVEGVTPSPGARVFKIGLHSVVVDVSPDGRRVVISATSGLTTPSVWEEGSKTVQRFAGQPFSPAWFSPDGRELIGCGALRATRVDAKGNTRLGEYPGHPEPLRFATISADRKRVAAAGGQGQPLRVWDGERPIGPASFPRTAPELSGSTAVFSPDGSRYLTWNADGSVREYDTTTGAEARLLTQFNTGDAMRPSGAAYSSDGRRILLSVLQGANENVAAVVRIVDAKSGSLEQEVSNPEVRGRIHVFTGDGAGMYVGDPTGGIGIWDLGKRAYRGAIPGVQRIHAVSPCGRFLLTDDTPLQKALPERRANLRDANTGRVVAALEGFPNVFSPDSIWLTAAFTRDGGRVAVACPDLKIRIWNTRDGTLVSTVRDLSNFPKIGLAFTPDGQRLATVGFGVDVWEVNTGRAVVPRSTLRTPSRSVAFSADGRTLLLGGLDQTLFTRIESGRLSPPASESK
ncbi:MAG: WD40 repeat domain-containing serine/threonine protein kinase [Gemmataceae bacterium]